MYLECKLVYKLLIVIGLNMAYCLTIGKSGFLNDFFFVNLPVKVIRQFYNVTAL